MARPKVKGRHKPPWHKIAWDFKRDERVAGLTKEIKEGKTTSSSRIFPINATNPSWKRGFCTAKNFFLAAHDLDKMIALNNITDAKGNKHNEKQNDNPRTIVKP